MNYSLKERRLNFINKLFTLTSILSMLIIVFFSINLLINSSTVFKNFIFNIFNQIPIFGQLLYLYIKSLNIIDLSFFFDNIVAKALLFELLYYFIIMLFFYSFSLFSFIKFRNNIDKSFWFIISSSIILALIFVSPKPLLLLEHVYSISFSNLNIILNFLLLTQLLSLIYLMYLNKDLVIFNELVKYKIFKISSISIIAILLIFSSTLLLLNTQVTTVKEVLKVDYTISFESSANNVINIETPAKLQSLSNSLGVDIPKTISGGGILSSLDLDSINIGSITSSYIIDLFDDFIYNFIRLPIIDSLVSIFLISLIYIYNKKKEFIPFSSLIRNSVQLILSIILLLSLNNYGITLNILTSMIIIIALLDLSIDLKPYAIKLSKLVN